MESVEVLFKTLTKRIESFKTRGPFDRMNSDSLGRAMIHGSERRAGTVVDHFFVEQELHSGGSQTSLRSRSAANCRQARISSALRSGKSERISDSVIPEAR